MRFPVETQIWYWYEILSEATYYKAPRPPALLYLAAEYYLEWNGCSCLCCSCEGNWCTYAPFHWPIILAASGMQDKAAEMKAKKEKPNLGQRSKLMTRSKLPSEKAWSLNKNKWGGILALLQMWFSWGVRILPLWVGRRILPPLSWLEQAMEIQQLFFLPYSVLAVFGEGANSMNCVSETITC